MSVFKKEGKIEEVIIEEKKAPILKEIVKNDLVISVSVINGDLNIRKEASLTSPILGIYSNGSQIKVKDNIKNGFYPLADRDGYVMAKFVKR